MKVAKLSSWAIAAAVLISLVPASAQKEQFVDLGGFRLFTSQSGSGKPLVVFVAGLGEDLSTWQKVQPEVSAFSQTLAYDRAGLGKSDASPASKSVEQMVSELHALLRAAKAEPRYVLVGHSLGGAVVQLYAYTYPDEITGLVLVDPEDGRLLDRLQASMPAEEWNARQKMLDQMMAQASPAQRAELQESRASGKALAGALPLPKVPVILLTGTLKDPNFPGNPLEQDLKLELQNELLTKIPNAKHVLVPNSRHYIQEDAPGLVIDAIREVVNEARGKNGDSHAE